MDTIPSNRIGVVDKANSLHSEQLPERFNEALVKKTELTLKENDSVMKKSKITLIKSKCFCPSRLTRKFFIC